MNIKEFTTNQLVEELLARPETDPIARVYRDSEEDSFYLGDLDIYCEGKGLLLFVKGV
jgi:hypothetical protein